MKQHSNSSRYQLIPRTLVFIKNVDKYLLILKNKDGFGQNKLNGVGGHIEQGEDPFESAKREIFEETGLCINELELTGIIFVDTKINPGVQVFVFVCKTESHSIIKSEEGDLYWLTKEEIKNRTDVVEDLIYLIELCENHYLHYSPKLIQYKYNESGELRIDIIN